jgi:hypothetical protein
MFFTFLPGHSVFTQGDIEVTGRRGNIRSLSVEYWLWQRPLVRHTKELDGKVTEMYCSN